MDRAANILGVASGSMQLADVAVRLVQSVTTVIQKFQSASLTLNCMVNNCRAVGIACRRLRDWATAMHDAGDHSDPIVDDLVDFINDSRELLDAMQQALDQHSNANSPQRRWPSIARARVVIAMDVLGGYGDKLAQLVNVMHFLLDVVRLPPHERPVGVIRKDADSAWTIVNSEGNSSKGSGTWSSASGDLERNAPLQDRHFSFEAQLLTGPVYRRHLSSKTQRRRTHTRAHPAICEDDPQQHENVTEAGFLSIGERASAYSLATNTDYDGEVEVGPSDSEMVPLTSIPSADRAGPQNMGGDARARAGNWDTTYISTLKTMLVARLAVLRRATTLTPGEGWGLDLADDDVPWSELCQKCDQTLENGSRAVQAGSRWHVDCTTCTMCGRLPAPDAHFSIMRTGGLSCTDCVSTCNACGRVIADHAILTDNSVLCVICFRCQYCKRPIQNLKYTKNARGFVCVNDECQLYRAGHQQRRTRIRAARLNHSPASSSPLSEISNTSERSLVVRKRAMHEKPRSVPGSNDSYQGQENAYSTVSAGQTSAQSPALSKLQVDMVFSSPTTENSREESRLTAGEIIELYISVDDLHSSSSPRLQSVSEDLRTLLTYLGPLSRRLEPIAVRVQYSEEQFDPETEGILRLLRRDLVALRATLQKHEENVENDDTAGILRLSNLFSWYTGQLDLLAARAAKGKGKATLPEESGSQPNVRLRLR